MRVHGVRRLEQITVIAAVRRVVGLDVRDEQSARTLVGEKTQRRLLRTRVQWLLSRRVHGDAAAPAIEDVLERIPGSHGSDPALKVALPVQPLEHGDVGVRAIAVPVDARVRVSLQQLVVTGIGEVGPVLYAYLSSDVSVR